MALALGRAEGVLRMVAERCLTAAVDHRVGELIAA